MGIVASALCFCGSCAMSSAACCCMGSMGAKGIGRQAAKGSYVTLLGFSTLLAWVVQRYGEESDREVAELDFKCGLPGSDGDLVCSDDGFVLRVSFMMTMFFLVMLVGTLPMPTLTGDRRFAPLLGDGFFQSCWGVKILIWVALMVCTMFLPSSLFDDPDNGWAWACRIVSGIFLVLQVLLLIDFGYQWNEDWVSRAFDGEELVHKGWAVGIVVSAFVLNGLAIAGLVGLVLQYGDCKQGMTYAVITIIAYVTFTVITLFREQLIGQPGAVLPAAVVGFFATYLAWSATESIPGDKACRPLDNGSDLVVFVGLLITAISLLWAAYTASKRTSNLLAGDTGSSTAVTSREDTSGLYAVGTDSEGREILARDVNRGTTSGDAPVEASSNANDSIDDRPWFFFLIMITASMHMAMLLTNYGVNDPLATNNDSIGNVSTWVKIVSQWLCLSLFIWTLVAPRVLSGRDFEY